MQNRGSPREGQWSLGLAFLLFIAFLLIFALAGIGYWRFTEQQRDRRHNNNLINDLNQDIQDLLTFAANLTIPDNCTVDASNFTQPTSFPDDAFRIFGAFDPTQEMGFNASLIDPFNQTVLSLQNVSGVVAYLSDVIGQSATFADNLFAVQNVVDPTKQVMLDLSMVTSGFTRTMTVQDASGTIAYLSDIPPFGSTFLDDAFGVVNAVDNTKKVMLNCSLINGGTIRTMTIQDADGTIAYLSDLGNVTTSPFPDDEFDVFLAGDPTALTKFELSGLTANTTVIMAVQDASGIIAYLVDLPQIIEVTVNVSRFFPDIAHEGVSSLAELGTMSHIEVSFCGGGGGGGETNDSGPGGGGGSGSAIVDFLILEPTLKFTAFNVSLGLGGIGSGVGGDGGDGTPTNVVGQSVTGFSFDLTAYGGGGGRKPLGLQGQRGGGGGGGGGSAAFAIEGIAGDLGGLPGGLSGSNGFQGNHSNTRGPFKFPWWSGGGGGGRLIFSGASVGVSWQGGFEAFAEIRTGAASLFAPSLIRTGSPAKKTGSCAGGSGAADVMLVNDGDDGGDGLAVFRYYVI